MFFESDAYQRQAKKDEEDAANYLGPRQSASGGTGSTDPANVTPAVGAAGATSTAAASTTAPGPATGAASGPAPGAAPTATGADGEPSGAAGLAALAAANLRKESEAAGAGEERDGDEVPESWHFAYLILTAAYSPWGGNAPGEWKHLESSSGPKKRKSTAEVTVDSSNPVCNPAAMSRLNPNGDAFGRRQLAAAVNKEKELEKKQEKEKENNAAKNEALSEMKAGNVHAKTIGQNIEKMVVLKEREAKIRALEKKLMLGLGDPQTVKADLLELLDQC